ncbi:hypothetical protein V6K52_10075 [Knoellia sp. S7-12]|uniref:hypothetical protein n=1 Tax=Knoellia sp. S7-12 TaxID=3126698 RepID=UPI00336983F9
MPRSNNRPANYGDPGSTPKALSRLAGRPAPVLFVPPPPRVGTGTKPEPVDTSSLRGMVADK